MREGEVGLLEDAEDLEGAPPHLHPGHLLEPRPHTGEAAHQVALALARKGRVGDVRLFHERSLPAKPSSKSQTHYCPTSAKIAELLLTM